MIQLAKDTIDHDDMKALSGWLLTDPRLTKGELCEKFECDFAKKMGVNYAVFVNSGSSANLLALYGLMCSGKLSKGDKVIVPAVSWATDIAPVVQLGLEPVLCDINLRNLAICISELELILQKKKPKALLLVSVLGLPPDIEDIAYLCKKHDCILILDNCESLGSTYNGHYLETYAYCSTMSLYYGHMLSTVEGGVVFTNDVAFYNVLKMIRSHGWDRDLEDDLRVALRNLHDVDEFNGRYTFYHPGFNFRSTEINAFLGIRQLDKMDEFVEKRIKNFGYFQYYIKNEQWKPEIAKENLVSNLGYPVIHSKRDKLAKLCQENNIECRPLISGNIAKQPAYREYFRGQVFKNADIVQNQGIYLPNHPFLTEEELYIICKTVNSITA